MSAVTVVAGARSPLPVILAGVLAATFAVGFAAGASLPRSMGAGAQPGAAGHSVTAAATSAISPILDTSMAYTTIQGGVLVAPTMGTTSASSTCSATHASGEAAASCGEGRPLTPVLDTTRSHTTVQHGVVVLPGR